MKTILKKWRVQIHGWWRGRAVKKTMAQMVRLSRRMGWRWPEIFFIACVNGKYLILDHEGFEERNTAIINFIKTANKVGLYGLMVRDFSPIAVCTGDKPFPPALAKDGNFYSFSTATNNYDQVVPDFGFDRWGVVTNNNFVWDNYNTLVAAVRAITNPPRVDKIGWRGNIEGVPNRRLFFEKFFGNKNFDIAWTSPTASSAPTATADKTMTKWVGGSLPLLDQIKTYRYLVDIEGKGYSGRLKVLLHGPRAVFVADRPYKDLTFQGLKPWVHYVPVKRDFSDLLENLAYLRAHPALEKKIISAANKFADKYLTRAYALEKWRTIIARHAL